MKIEHMTDTAMLEGLAEEATELAQAALKLARVIRGENPTPVTIEAARSRLTEETADVLLYLQEVRENHRITLQEISEIMTVKRQRWAARLERSDAARQDQG